MWDSLLACVSRQPSRSVELSLTHRPLLPPTNHSSIEECQGYWELPPDSHPFSKSPWLFYWKDFILSAIWNYFNQKDFSLFLVFFGTSPFLSVTLKENCSLNLHYTSLCLFAEFLILGFLSVLSKFLESWWNPELNIALCNKAQKNGIKKLYFSTLARALPISNNKCILRFFRRMENSQKNKSWRIVLHLRDLNSKYPPNPFLKTVLRMSVGPCPLTRALVRGDSIIQLPRTALPDRFSDWMPPLGQLNFDIHFAPWRTFFKPWLNSFLSLEDHHPSCI